MTSLAEAQEKSTMNLPMIRCLQTFTGYPRRKRYQSFRSWGGHLPAEPPGIF